MRMKTERLFYEDVCLKEFEGKVLSCLEQEGTFQVILDRTAFYPEGGGQPAEGGTLGGRKVLNVVEDGEEIIHITDGPLEPGTTVTGRINWERRFRLMQQHSGEHIVSGLIHKKFGYDNVGFHMGSEFITIDLNGLITPDQLKELEEEANDYLWTNRKVKVFIATEEEARSLPYRSKKELEGEVRLVEFPGADLCACCGTHVEYTGQIGLIKLVSVRHFREGVRIEMLCGKDALEYLNLHYSQNSEIGVELSVKPWDTCQAVKRLEQEILEGKNALNGMKQKIFSQTAEACRDRGNLFLFVDSMDANDLRRMADRILDTCGGICAVFSGDDKEGYKYALGQRDGDVRDLLKKMNLALKGRGGGKPFFAQGSLKGKKEEIREFFRGEGFAQR